jgi:mannose-6-phosphate isomerase-like protein (cupin superfamily)
MIIRQARLHPINFDGLRIYDYTAEKPCSSSLALIDVPPGVHHRLAKSSRSDKYYYVVEGQLFFTLDGIEYNLGAGDFCLVSREHTFSYTNRGDKHTKLILVHTPAFKLEAEEFLD